MDRILLYYPTIEFPRKDWLKQALLYSDKVSSILPYTDEDSFPDSIKYLMWKEEYSPVFIEDVISENRKEYKKFAKKFLKDVDTNHHIMSASSKSARANVIDSLFNSKMSSSVLNGLFERGLAENKDENRIYLPSNIAIYYMSILSQFVSCVNRKDIIIPSTDYTRFRRLPFDEVRLKSDEAFSLIFENCLPVPHESVSIEEIVKFKKNHIDELKRFRLFYLEAKDSLKNARDSNDLKEGLQNLTDRVNLEIGALEDVYSKNKIKFIYSNIDSLFSLENSKLFNSLMSAGIISTAINPKVGLGVSAVLFIARLVNLKYCKKGQKNELNYIIEASRAGLVS